MTDPYKNIDQPYIQKHFNAYSDIECQFSKLTWWPQEPWQTMFTKRNFRQPIGLKRNDKETTKMNGWNADKGKVKSLVCGEYNHRTGSRY